MVYGHVTAHPTGAAYNWLMWCCHWGAVLLYWGSRLHAVKMSVNYGSLYNVYVDLAKKRRLRAYLIQIGNWPKEWLVLFNVHTKHKLENRQSYRHADPRRQRPQVAQRQTGLRNTVFVLCDLDLLTTGNAELSRRRGTRLSFRYLLTVNSHTDATREFRKILWTWLNAIPRRRL